MDVSLALGRKAIAAAAAAALVVLLLLLWIGGEAHYRNCLTAADMRYPAAPHQPLTANEAGNEATFALTDERARLDAIDGCSRLP